MKTTPICASSLLLFYHYVKPEMSKGKARHLSEFLQGVCGELNLGGRLRVAPEGLNCTISGTRESLREFSERLVRWPDDKGPFGGDGPDDAPDFKYIDDLPSDRHFKDCKILPVNELVFYGVKKDEAPLEKGGVHLSPVDYHEMMKSKDAVIIDVRNSYEADIGKFVGQEKDGGATYIDPKMRKSTDFKAWLDKDETKKGLEGKKVLMYCTGGVRCERASALLKNKMGEKVDEVYQLKGGIEKYMKEFGDGGFWKGKNFVFDKREAFGVDNMAGVGGVVRKEKKKNKNKSEPAEVMGNCCVCSRSWDRYIGKKKCYTCGVPVLMCDSCMSLKVDKIEDRKLEVRCPLCKEEEITVPAESVGFTDNGVKVSNAGDGVARSVLKWGGGHAAEKKRQRLMKRKACKFGAACQRKDCWFSHNDGEPEGGGRAPKGSKFSASE